MEISLLLLFLAIHPLYAFYPNPPKIIIQMPSKELMYLSTDQLNVTSNDLQLKCEAKGDPAPKYRWTKDGQNFDWNEHSERMTQQIGRGTITITKPMQEDSGLYQCFAENIHGIATSDSVAVRVFTLKPVNVELKKVNASEGVPLTLHCEAPIEWPKPTIYWLKQNATNENVTIFTQNYTDNLLTRNHLTNDRLTVDPTGNVHFTNVTRADESNGFYYTCVITSKITKFHQVLNQYELSISSENSTLPQFYPTTLQYVSDQNEIRWLGESVEFFCIFGGTPIPALVWKKDSITMFQNGRNWNWEHNLLRNHDKSLLIRSVRAIDAGTYTCEVYNQIHDIQRHSFNLTVNGGDATSIPPHFIVKPFDQIVSEGELIVFECVAHGIPEDSIKWTINGKPIEDAPPDDRRTIKHDSITIANVNQNDTGNYGCNASNSYAYIYEEAYLNVINLAPEFIERHQQVVAVTGRGTTLPCRFFGVPFPANDWSRNGEALSDERYSKQSNGDLVIKDVNIADAGKYTCNIFNAWGESETSTLLIVKRHSRINIKNIKKLKSFIGESLNITCKLTVDPTLKANIQWYKDDNVIRFENESHFIRLNEMTLFIWKMTNNDAGIYTCEALTKLDSVTDSFNLTFYSQETVENDDIRLECKRNVAKFIHKYRQDGKQHDDFLVKYYTSLEPDKWQTYKKQGRKHSTGFSVTKLIPWMNYTFCVTVKRRQFSSKCCNHFCQTDPDVPGSNPINVNVAGTTPTNVIISWMPMPPIQHFGPDFHYRIHWKLDSEGVEWNMANVSDWKIGEFTIEHQPTYVQYRVRVKAANYLGESRARVSDVLGYSGEGEPSQFPAEFALVNVMSSTSALLRWNPVPAENLRGSFGGYKIHIWNDVDGEGNKREIIIKYHTNQYLIPNLRANVVNYAQVLAFNRHWDGPVSRIVTFKTPEGVPDSVETFEAYQLGSTGMLLKWSKPVNPNGQLTGYNIYYEEVDGNGNRMERKPQIHEPEMNHAKLSGLKPLTTYRIFIEATTNAGKGNPKNIEIKTPFLKSKVPDQPSLECESMPNDETAIRINWLPKLDGKSGTNFFVKYRIKGNAEWSSTGQILDDDFAIVENLTPNESYEFKVVSVDGDYATESDVQDGPPIKYGKLGALSTSRLGKFVVAIIIFVVVMSIVATVYFYLRYRRMNSIDSYLKFFDKGKPQDIDPKKALNDQAHLLPYDKKYEFPREQLSFGETLGDGQFGIVYKAIAQGLSSSENETTVAVKMIKKIDQHNRDNHKLMKEALWALANELKILIHLGRHLNVVSLIGAVTNDIQNYELMVIVEYCPHGNIQKILNTQHFVSQIDVNVNVDEDHNLSEHSFACPSYNSSTSSHSSHIPGYVDMPKLIPETISEAIPIRFSYGTSDLLCWSFQVAHGMDYLASQKVFHGDLAARNVLLFDCNVVKICDFGLARSIQRTGDYRKEHESLLPYKWLAIESMNDQVFSTYSDVWSFGVFLWELFSLGETPYPNIPEGFLKSSLNDGHRMAKPTHATQAIYDIMVKCWQKVPEERPLFNQLADNIGCMMETAVVRYYIDMNEHLSEAIEKPLNSEERETYV